jgi:hypothetical protein
MSTSTTFSNRSSLVENWDTETLIIFLRDLNINLDEDDFKILRKQKIDGQTFPDMTERKFMKDGIKRGPAISVPNGSVRIGFGSNPIRSEIYKIRSDPIRNRTGSD